MISSGKSGFKIVKFKRIQPIRSRIQEMEIAPEIDEKGSSKKPSAVADFVIAWNNP